MANNRIKSISHKLLKRGVAFAADPKGKKRAQLVNTVCLLGMAFCFCFAMMNVFQELYKPLVGLVMGFGLCAFIFFLNGSTSERHQKAARILLIFSAYTFYFANANFLFVGKLSEFFYIFIVILGMVLIDGLVYQIIILLVCILSFYLPNYFFQYYDNEVFGYANMGVLFITIFWLIRQLIDLNEQHEAKLIKDKQTILEQKQQIEEFNQLKSQFFTDLSHEIRTPLTLLQGYTESLIQSPGVSTHEQQRKFQIIQEQGENINNLLSNILGLSKMENQAFGLNTTLTNLSPFLDAIKSRFSFLFENKDIAFYLEQTKKEASVSIDPQLFEHALTNLLTNALKNTPPKGEVLIKTETDANHLLLKVIDNGKGIPKKHLTQIFERYFQVDKSMLSQGMGIGLAYTKRIIEAHGFNITVESKENIRTCFCIAMPLDKVIIEKEDNALSQTFAIGAHGKPHRVLLENEQKILAKNCKILIAEDNLQMQVFLTSVLEGYSLTFAKNGKDALNLLSKEVYDVLITDYAMPVMDGEELVQKVKSMNLQIPILVLTARTDNQAKRKMLRLGIDGYITKPFMREELLHYIEKSVTLMASIGKQQSGLDAQERKFIHDHAAIFNQELNEFIENNLRSHDFSVENIAAHFNISKSTLNRRVKSLLGQTTKQIIMEARLQKARNMFRSMPMAKNKEIAEAVGIKNSTYLNELMEKRFGEKP